MAGTVASVLVLIGVAIGILAVVGPLTFLRAPGEALVTSMLDAGHDLVVQVANFAGSHDQGKLSIVLAATLSVVLPGLLAGCLVGLGRSGPGLRRVGMALSVVGAIAVFATQRTLASAVAALLLLVFGVLLAVAASTVISIASGAFAAFVAATQLHLLYDNSDPSVVSATGSLSKAFPQVDPSLLHWTLLGLAALPFVAVAWSLLRD